MNMGREGQIWSEYYSMNNGNGNGTGKRSKIYFTFTSSKRFSGLRFFNQEF
jgi:hypothetical protein